MRKSKYLVKILSLLVKAGLKGLKNTDFLDIEIIRVPRSMRVHSRVSMHCRRSSWKLETSFHKKKKSTF